MKKFIAILVAMMVMLTFLMVNYLMWDKEKLMKQSENDRIEQDWLRGQNRTLQSTITEQDKENARLTAENKTLQLRVETLSGEVKTYVDRENDYVKTIELKKNVVDTYKRISLSILQEEFQNWLLAVSEKDYLTAYDSMANDHRIFGRNMTFDAFETFMIKNITSIALTPREIGEGVLLFESSGSEPDDLTIRIRAGIDVVFAEGRDDNVGGLIAGKDTVLITFKYETDKAKWKMTSLIPE